MDRQFTFRFYQISRNNTNSPSFVDTLRSIAAINPIASRERTLAANYTVRLETLEDDGTDAIRGELLRCQNTNLPAELNAGVRSPLGADVLGHSVVFRYNHSIGALGIQYEPRIVAPGRLLDYLSSFNASAIYSLLPHVDGTSWQKFNTGETRKLAIRIANPIAMEDLDSNGRAASDSFKAMAAAYDAPSIYIEISMGHRKGALSEAARGLAVSVASLLPPGAAARLDSLTAVTVVGSESEELNLIEEIAKVKFEISIDDKDPVLNYTLKANSLTSIMKARIG